MGNSLSRTTMVTFEIATIILGHFTYSSSAKRFQIFQILLGQKITSKLKPIILLVVEAKQAFV